MKVRIELVKDISEDEVIIKCKTLDNKIQKLEKVITEITDAEPGITFYKENIEYYFDINKIIFFETTGNYVYAHTKNEVYQVKYRLYELEQILPNNFIRVSKGAILNCKLIYSIKKSLTSSSLVQFEDSHKQVYVSRYYYKQLQEILAERRNYEI